MLCFLTHTVHIWSLEARFCTEGVNGPKELVAAAKSVNLDFVGKKFFRTRRHLSTTHSKIGGVQLKREYKQTLYVGTILPPWTL